MDEPLELGPVVFTHKAQCRDCYRCLRMCPVKAIRLENGQASVVPELCIACGTCIRECPQGAKAFRNDVALVRRLLAHRPRVLASVAPSYVGLLHPWERQRLPPALRCLGFSYVSETAVGAWHVAQESTELLRTASSQEPKLCTACPAFVRYVREYRPALAPFLMPLASPMLTHARLLKARFPDAAVVFIGPCVAKKDEAGRSAGLVDAVLTFEELLQWLEDEELDLSAFEESDFDELAPGSAGLFPLPGGLVEAGGMDERALSESSIAVSGFDELREALDSLESCPQALLVEALFCPQGCINGPATGQRQTLFARRLAVLREGRRPLSAPPRPEHASTWELPSPSPQPLAPVDEEELRRLLEETGKARREDQLDCGACGYPSCRAKAEAVLRGMAEREMCLPLMRRLAEKRTDKIIETSPNGIIIVDAQLSILHMNPAFRHFFLCSDAVLGKKVSYLFDPEPFETLAAGSEAQVECTQRHEAYNLICHEIFYALREEGQFVGIFVNITNSQGNKRKLDELRSHTVQQAHELLQHQFQMAQQMAKFLGEHTAQGEALVKNLLALALTDERDGG
ncbi:MAG: [Fe-Fe] hydrogenase large subunit C-terminal domain-containing protein [Myxococcota bacterium]|nr:[Fe-Fe] hydrogenase large subunit C-terminal domain-containing protein [Myxococcota bacterium]